MRFSMSYVSGSVNIEVSAQRQYGATGTGKFPSARAVCVCSLNCGKSEANKECFNVQTKLTAAAIVIITLFAHRLAQNISVVRTRC